jgi:P27 family predicted phage terminase small subunit
MAVFGACARVTWRAHAGDLRSFQLLCETLAHERELRELLTKEGLLIPGADGNQKAHPALKALETCRAQAHRMLESFGLNPRSRQSVDIAPPPKLGRLASLDLP